ncbi:multidrug effflux MFS transporter [Desulfogranum japonicum]|uniref:multidrug effflux MFS transporter n=1 Tax=Desulfogranum japonicum TaxID=231447 RepID=UPI0003FA64EC|nr:multidrug effflux MFS transporter [Desulfogranum japonicum]
MKKPQKNLGNTGTLLFLALISAFPPLSTDLYLPAMPQMVEALATSHSKVNMTLSMFFVFYAGGLLFWGPLSEKFGRKPILLAGIGGYIIASIFCASSLNIEQLIVSRILQAFGGSAITVVATAIVKDLYDGREREKVMATVMSMVIIAPMVAPVLGAFLLKIASWRMVFLVLSGIGAVAALITFLFQETLDEKYSGSIVCSWGRLAVVLKNPGFIFLLVIFCLVPMAMMAFLASSSFIYISGFGLSPQRFSFFFAFNALFAMVGPMLYMKLSKHLQTKVIISGCFVLLMCCGIVVGTLGHLSPWLFALALAPATLAVITMRVPGVNLMLDQQDHDTGSASALINFFSMIMGSLGMFLVSLCPHHLIESLGAIQFMVGLIGGFLWLLVRNRKFALYRV